MPDSLAVVQVASGLLALTAVLLAVTYLAALLIGAATLTAVVAVGRPLVLLLVARRRAAQLFAELRQLSTATRQHGRHR